ncbi:hypothetical protein WMY93_003979 [Mugilogobius chulae]|uniref:Uncharacterized protein n=1 Tax=Mugilogobius chulae TaxID=88201 RepID=A0AAW0PQ01_9GOBI
MLGGARTYWLEVTHVYGGEPPKNYATDAWECIPGIFFSTNGREMVESLCTISQLLDQDLPALVKASTQNHQSILGNVTEFKHVFRQALNAAQEAVNAPQQALNAAQEEVKAPQQALDAAQEAVNAPQQALDAAQEEVNAPQQALNAAPQQTSNAAPHQALNTPQQTSNAAQEQLCPRRNFFMPKRGYKRKERGLKILFFTRKWLMCLTNKTDLKCL